MAFIPMPYTVDRLRDDIVVGEDAHGNPIRRPQPPIEVAAAGWSEPTAEQKQQWRDIDHQSFDIDLMADAGKIAPGDQVRLGGEVYEVLGRSNFDHGPFGFVPGLDSLRLHRTKG